VLDIPVRQLPLFRAEYIPITSEIKYLEIDKEILKLNEEIDILTVKR